MKFSAMCVLMPAMAWSAPAMADCVERIIKEPNGQSHAFVILVPPGEVPSYIAKGFKEKSCSLTPKQIEIAHSNVCRMAAVPGLRPC